MVRERPDDNLIKGYGQAARQPGTQGCPVISPIQQKVYTRKRGEGEVCKLLISW